METTTTKLTQWNSEELPGDKLKSYCNEIQIHLRSTRKMNQCYCLYNKVTEELHEIIKKECQGCFSIEISISFYCDILKAELKYPLS
jgi:HKD family nuclease